MDFGTFLKELRIKRGLTQAQVAKDLGIHTRTYILYEKNKFLPKENFIDKIASYYATTEDTQKELKEKLLSLLRREKARRLGIEFELEEEDKAEFVSEKEIDDLSLFSNTVLKDMKKRNLHLRNLASLTRIDPDRLNRILLCEVMPTREEVEKIAHVLDQPVEKYAAMLSVVNEEFAIYLMKDKNIRDFIKSYYQMDKRKRELFHTLLNSILKIITTEEEK